MGGLDADGDGMVRMVTGWWGSGGDGGGGESGGGFGDGGGWGGSRSADGGGSEGGVPWWVGVLAAMEVTGGGVVMAVARGAGGVSG